MSSKHCASRVSDIKSPHHEHDKNLALNTQAFEPHVTVATIIEREGQFLLVEEWSGGDKVINQPAGHLDANESLIEAAVRETLEETGWNVEITGVVGVGLYQSPSNGVTYMRTAFAAKALNQEPNYQLDDGIIGPIWMTLEELEASEQLRSPMVLDTIRQYLNNGVHTLDLVYA